MVLRFQYLSLTVFIKVWGQISRSWEKILICCKLQKKAVIFLHLIWLWYLLTWNFLTWISLPYISSLSVPIGATPHLSAPEHPPGGPRPSITTRGVHAVGIFGLGFLTPEISDQPLSKTLWSIPEKFTYFENPVLIFIYRETKFFSSSKPNPVLISFTVWD